MWVIGAWGAAFFYPAIGAAYQALWLRSVPRDQIARVVSLRELFTMVTGPLGMVLAPLVATHFAPVALTWPPLSAAFGAGATGAHALTLAVAALLVVIIAVAAAPRLVRAASSKSRIETTLGE